MSKCSKSKKVKPTKTPSVECETCGLEAEKPKSVCKPKKIKKRGK